MPSVPLRAEPSVRQINAILARVERELRERGARVSRTEAGALRFRMPFPWQARSLGILSAASSGTALVSAGAGGPRRVRYALRFTALQALAALVSVALLVAGWEWPRTELVLGLIAIWLVLYALPSAAATLRFRRILGQVAHEVIDRRSPTRTSTLEHPALPTDGAPKGDDRPATGA